MANTITARVREVRTVVLHIEATPDEAAALHAVTRRIGGMPTGTRGFFDRIRLSLLDVGVPPDCNASIFGVIRFDD